MSESVRGEGGRVWVPKKKGDTRDPLSIPEEERWYFLEEKYPKYKNLVPRDVATREIFHVCREMGMGIGRARRRVPRRHPHPGLHARREDQGRDGDLREVRRRRSAPPPDGHLPGDALLDGRAVREPSRPGPNLEPLPGSPKNQATNIPGLFASGEADYAYHGANRLGANSLLSCIYGGMIGGPAMVSYAKNVAKGSTAVPSSVFEDAKKQWTERFASIDRMTGTENPTSWPASSAR
jgi:succinate dehydrogenase / fumarate reductase flavoprotein subunit